MKKFLVLALIALSSFAMAKDGTVSSPTQLDDLIRGEMAAVKSYDTLLTKVKDASELETLKGIRMNHVNAVTKLKKFADKDVKEDTMTAGPWGTFASSWVGGAKLFGDKTALKAIKQGEEHGVTEYKEALEDSSLTAELKSVIRSDLMPKQEAHIKTINKYL